MASPIRVLHVDDEPDFGELVSEFLPRKSEDIEVEVETDASDALERLEDGDIDCVVSDYEMPKMDGLELLEEVRDEYHDLPFILFTGKGSEEVASEAISRGVTDYLRKETGTEKFELLANRIEKDVERQRSRQKLRESRKRLDLFFDQSPLGVVEWDDESRVVRMNGRAEEILGYDESELRGRSWEAVVPEHEKEDVSEIVHGILRDEGGYHNVNENVTKDGETIVCEWHNRAVTDEEGGTVAFLSIFDEVTEEQERERELRRYRQMINSMHEAACVYDEEGRFVVVNEYLADFYNTTPEELEGRESNLVPSLPEGSYEELLEGDREEIQGEIEDEFPGHGHAVIDYMLTQLSADGGFKGAVGVARDVTERKERERELRRNKRCFEAVFEDPEMLVGLLEADGTLREANETAMGYVKADHSDLIGEPFWKTPWWRTGEEDGVRDEVKRRVERAAEGEYVGYGADLQRPDGTPYSVEGTLRPVTDEDGEVVSLVVSARDITERKEHERMVERRNETLEDVASFMSHDLRTPLSTVRGRHELALETGDTEHVEKASAALDRVETLLDEMTSALRTGEVVDETDEVRLDEAAEYVADTVSLPEEASVEVTDPLTVDCDEEAVIRMLENLVRNSVEHSDDDEIEIRIGKTGGGFYYEDDGPGIPEDEREKVFKPGYSTKKDRDGAGMGMASVRQIVLAHGWRIRVEDAEKLDGVRFEVQT